MHEKLHATCCVQQSCEASVTQMWSLFKQSKDESACLEESSSVHFTASMWVAVQSILTGESGSVEKYLEAVRDRKAVYQDKTNLLFSVGTPLLRMCVCSVLFCVSSPFVHFCFFCALLWEHPFLAHKRLFVLPCFLT